MHIEQIRDDDPRRMNLLALRIATAHRKAKRAKLYLDLGYSVSRVVEITGIDADTAKAMKAK